MKCPIDQTTLQMTEREGVEIDYCPECRGIWLDRGELDRIIDAAVARRGSDSGRRQYERDSDEHDTRRYEQRGHGKKKDRLGFLGDLLGGE